MSDNCRSNAGKRKKIILNITRKDKAKQEGIYKRRQSDWNNARIEFPATETYARSYKVEQD